MADPRFRPFVIPPTHPARRQLQAAWDLYLAIGQEQPLVGEGPIVHIVTSQMARVWRLYRSALSLAADGFGPEAELLARPMYETNLTTFWAARHPDEAADRFDLHLDYLYHLAQEAMPDGQEVVPMVAEERARAVKLFGKYGELPWSGKNVRQLDAEFQMFHGSGSTKPQPFEGFLGGVYRWLNWSLHASPMSLLRTTTVTSENRIFNVVPDELDVGDAIKYASDQAMFSMMIMALVNRDVPSPKLKRCIFEVWRSINPTSYVTGRNDPCPCGSGEKYKMCHLYR